MYKGEEGKHAYEHRDEKTYTQSQVDDLLKQQREKHIKLIQKLKDSYKGDFVTWTMACEAAIKAINAEIES